MGPFEATRFQGETHLRRLAGAVLFFGPSPRASPLAHPTRSNRVPVSSVA